jgi:hypothetical protein
MTLTDRRNLSFCIQGEPIVRPLRAAWLILQGLMEGREGPTAEFVEITSTDAILGDDLWERDATEEGKDSRDPLGNLWRQERWDGSHKSVF